MCNNIVSPFEGNISLEYVSPENIGDYKSLKINLNEFNVDVKLLRPGAKNPFVRRDGDAGYDLTVCNFEWAPRVDDKKADILCVYSGIAIAPPPGLYFLLFPRSSVHKTGLILCNSVGVIDSSYRGEIMAKFYAPKGSTPFDYGDRFAQLIPQQEFSILSKIVDDLPTSNRGDKGFGSTGK